MPNELNWTEENGVWRAEANGFIYSIKRSLCISGQDLWVICDGYATSSVVNSVECAKKECQSHHQTVGAAIDAACTKERENADRLAKALEEASFVLSMCIGLDLPFIPKQEAQPGSPKAMIDEALAAHKDARK